MAEASSVQCIYKQLPLCVPTDSERLSDEKFMASLFFCQEPEREHGDKNASIKGEIFAFKLWLKFEQLHMGIDLHPPFYIFSNYT